MAMTSVGASEIVPLAPGESKWLYFEFAELLADGVSLDGSPTVSVVSPTLSSSPISQAQIDGTRVVFYIADVPVPVNDVDYVLLATCDDDTAGTANTHQVRGRLRVCAPSSPREKWGRG